jgi:hypothetical protein
MRNSENIVFASQTVFFFDNFCSSELTLSTVLLEHGLAFQFRYIIF